MNPHTISRALEQYLGGLTVGQGRLTGEPLTLLPWQKRFIRGAFGQPDDAGLSVARGNGKTTLLSGILAACVDVDGPLVEEAAESVLVSSSFDQSTIAFRHLLRFLGPSIERYPRRFRVQDSANRASVTDRETGAMVRVMGSDPRRLQGLAPKLILSDEVAAWADGQIYAMLSAHETARGKIPDSRMLWIGTRPATPDHPFEKALQGGLGYSQVHAAPDHLAPFQRRTWLKANPSLPIMPDLEKIIRLEAAKAKRDPDRLQSFRALRLNQGTSDVLASWLVSPELWESLEDQDAAREGQYALGLDLGTSAAMSAASAYWPVTGRLESLAAFPTIPSLSDRGAADGVGPLYEHCHNRGELIVAGQRVSDVTLLLREALDRWGTPGIIASDRWREAELREKLEAMDFPLTGLEVRGQGFKDGGEDVRLFRAACVDRRVRPVPSLLLRAAIAEARTLTDPAGNSKLSKSLEGGRREKARDDAIAAAVLAVSSGVRHQNQATPDTPMYVVVG